MRTFSVPTAWPSWLLMVLFSLAAFAPPSGIGVCLGEGGHVEFGTSAPECPCPHDQPAEPADHDDEKDHPDCADLTLDSQIAQAPNELDRAWEHGPVGEVFTALVRHAETWAVSQRRRNRPRADGGPPRCPDRLLEIRTVVLRA